MTVPLLVSVDSLDEARVASRFPVAIIDFKDPTAGSLGRCGDAILHSINHLQPPALGFSAACGELSDLFDDAKQCEAVASVPPGFRFVKAGPALIRDRSVLTERLQQFADCCHPNITPVAVAYADDPIAGSLAAEEIVELASDVGFRWFLLDTMSKDGRRLPDWISFERLGRVIRQCHDNEMRIVLAGSLSLPLASQLLELGPDLLGVRGAVCSGDRARASIRKSWRIGVPSWNSIA
ncbi:MAG: (5-formylfuran-3-yl)methyl phosphate synthase [Pirellulaceae bacterium]